jgi:hypothetical protein
MPKEIGINNLALNTTMNMWGVQIPIGPEEMGLILLGFLLLIGVFVIVVVLRRKLR